MTLQKIQQLQPGDQVYWADPDNGICSRVLTIKEIEVHGDVVQITDVNNGYLECFAKELS